MATESASLFDRTVRRFRKAWRGSGSKGADLKRRIDPDLSADNLDSLRRQIDACLEAHGGEVSARTRAANLGELYLVLSETGRRRFVEVLAEDYDLDEAAVDEAVAARVAVAGADEKRVADERLREALIPKRIRLLSQFNGLRQGVKFLVDLRAEIMRLSRDNPALAPVEHDLHELLASWFDVGFLELTRITWDTPASVLEKLIEYEAVHAIRSWDDLKNRLEADRRCYAFFHPSMPGEPLIFVQVALLSGMADNVQTLLDESAPLDDPHQANTAIFYSISNCQRGLAGVSFGNFLIKSVADDLARDLPDLKTFATLSPIPGFRGWLDRHLERDSHGLLSDVEEKALAERVGMEPGPRALAKALDETQWTTDPASVELLQPILLRLGARYLLKARRRGHAFDGVAHFHLTNGARIERLNWMADTSERGLRQSAGMMVNYLYKLDAIDKNHEAYTGEGKVTAATAVRKLMRT